MHPVFSLDFLSRAANPPPFDRLVARGVEPYDRARHLPRVLPVAPEEIADKSDVMRRAILRRLARALRAERNRGRAGHWTYDLNRHIALAQAYAAERRLVAAVRNSDNR